MITALTYIMTSMTLGLLLFASGRQGHEERDGADIYRYPSSIVWVIFGGVVFCLLVPFVVYFFATPDRHPSQLCIPVAVFGSLAGLFAWGYLYYRKFYIVISGDAVCVGGLSGTREATLTDVTRFALIEGGKGGRELSVYDGRGALILKASSTIQDFDDLVAVIRRRIRGHKVLYEYRDKWGKWTRQDNP